ncbi:hypothetical protein G9A89_022617 [Geosiphon pyriformis]|nr:hypothetical protein G9A89_022617 [Geosiphon pyriformis]
MVMSFSSSAASLNKDELMVSSNLKGKMAARDSFSVTIAGRILLWGFRVVFELVVGADKLIGAVADKLLVAAVNKLEVDILVVDRLVAVSLAGKWFDIGLDLGSDFEFEIYNRGFDIDFLIVNCCYKIDSRL